jgi:hypothetical protein
MQDMREYTGYKSRAVPAWTVSVALRDRDLSGVEIILLDGGQIRITFKTQKPPNMDTMPF